MARPRSTNIDYFPVYAESTKVLEILDEKYGDKGFAFYFRIRKFLASQENLFYDCRNIVDMEFLSRKLKMNSISATEILEDLSIWGDIDRSLWEKKIIFCESLVSSVANCYKKRKSPPPCVEMIFKTLGLSKSKYEDSCSFRSGNYLTHLVSGAETPQSIRVKELSSYVYTPEESSSSPIVPSSGDAAAAFSEILKTEKQKKEPPSEPPIPEEVHTVLSELFELRGNVISPGALKKYLIEKFTKNPLELSNWKTEILNLKSMRKITENRREYVEKELKKKADWQQYQNKFRETKNELKNLRITNQKTYKRYEEIARKELTAVDEKWDNHLNEKTICTLILDKMAKIMMDEIVELREPVPA